MLAKMMKFINIFLLLLSSLSCANTQAQKITSVEDIRDSVHAYRMLNEREIIKDFVELLSLPNIADNLSNIGRNADHIIQLLESRGFSTERLTAGGAPYIFAELQGNENNETILIYAHYDGQPVLEENWKYLPFTPTVLDAALDSGGQPVDWQSDEQTIDPEWRLYGRSASDDKMPIIALIHTLDALNANGIPLSVNLKLLLDGEEEKGSPTVGQILQNHSDLLGSDLLLFCDGPMHQSRRLQLVFGVRGDTGVDITAYGATRPLHSGHYGNWAPNPIMQLSYLLTTMRDDTGYISINGYYDDVIPLSSLERTAIFDMPILDESLKHELSVHTPEGDGMRLEELITLPAINARGFIAGGVAEKGRNIIVSTATVSLDLRLVPEQTPKQVRSLIESHIVDQGFFIVHEKPTPELLRTREKIVKLDWRGGYPAYRTAIDHPVAQRLKNILTVMAPDLLLTPTMGGSLPLYEFGTRLTAPIIILPLANHDNNQHAENENIRLANVWDAIAIYAIILATYGNSS